MWTDRQSKLSKTGVKLQLIAAFMRQRKTGIIAFKPFRATWDYGMLSMSASVANMNVRWDFKNAIFTWALFSKTSINKTCCIRWNKNPY